MNKINHFSSIYSWNLRLKSQLQMEYNLTQFLLAMQMYELLKLELQIYSTLYYISVYHTNRQYHEYVYNL